MVVVGRNKTEIQSKTSGLLKLKNDTRFGLNSPDFPQTYILRLLVQIRGCRGRGLSDLNDLRGQNRVQMPRPRPQQPQ